MKPLNFLLLLIIPFIFSCNSTSDHEWYSVKSVKVDRGDCEIEPCIEIEVEYPIISETIPNSTSINEELQRMLGQYLILDGKAIPKEFDLSIKAFEESFEEHFKNYAGAANLFTAIGEAKVTKDTDHIKSVMIYMDLYTGGANGMNYYNAFNFDPNSGKILHLTDLISNYDAFHLIAEQQFRRQFQIADDVRYEDVGFFMDNGVFTISNKIGFENDKLIVLYDKYEIAAGVQGPIKLEIPLADVHEVLFEEYR